MKYPSVENSTKAVEEGRIKFYPERWSKTYSHWMHKIRDWCISRQLWWGHQVPVWTATVAGAGSDASRAAVMSSLDGIRKALGLRSDVSCRITLAEGQAVVLTPNGSLP